MSKTAKIALGIGGTVVLIGVILLITRKKASAAPASTPNPKEQPAPTDTITVAGKTYPADITPTQAQQILFKQGFH